MRTDERTDGQTDMTKERVSFRRFANAPKSVFPVCYNNAEVLSVDVFSVRRWCYCSLYILVPLIFRYCQRCG